MTPKAHSQLYGWANLVERFLLATREELLASLRDHHQRNLGSSPVESQVRAWKESIQELQHELSSLVRERPAVAQWGIVFEYELPRERGRRPDVTLLTRKHLVVVEFKGAPQESPAFLDQVSAYVRDLMEYHEASRELTGHAMLLLMGSDQAPSEIDDVLISGRGHLRTALLDLTASPGWEGVAPGQIEAWLESDYAPLPSLVSAARAIFNNEPLPAIRRAQSAGIPATLKHLAEITSRARAQSEHHLALVTGVPGAGKTLVGLQFVYATHFAKDEKEKLAVLLSGNGPLVKVLQHALRSRVFVQDVHGFLRQYGGEQRRLPIERIWVYDEAQRAWDSERVREMRGHDASEPEDFVRLSSRMGGWSVIVGLIGEGQEIHIGEEAGLKQWNTAIAGSVVPWHVHCPERVAALFSGAKDVKPSPVLDLDVSLRSHVAADVQRWVRTLLEGNIGEANEAATRARAAGFRFYASRLKERVIGYARDRYLPEIDKRYGWVASSKAKNLMEYDIRNEFQFTRRFREGPWFNDPVDSMDSCCQLREVATEFQCQGLELDLPMIAWGDDLRWEDGKWWTRPAPRSKAKDPHKLRLNSYRVLLSRGRDGVVVFVPPDRQLDATFEVLVRAGLSEL